MAKARDKTSMTVNEFESAVATELKKYMFLKVKPARIKLCRKLYKEGYSVAQTTGMIILNT